MNEVAETNLDDIWGCASPEVLQRTVDLVRKVLKAPAARVSSDGSVVRHLCDPDHILTSERADDGDTLATLAVPLRLSSQRGIGALCVFDRAGRVWSDEDGALLDDLAAGLTSEIELKLELLHCTKAQAALDATNTSLLAVADRIPGLVFQRTKIDAARSRYTFFGSAKTQLPAVRKMMNDGGSGDLSFVHRDDRDLVRSAILRSNLEETDLDLTFRVKDLDRSIRWLRSQSIVRRDAEDRVYWDGLIFDISDLVAAREEAEAARTLRDKLLLDINREMRTPLQAIVGFTDFLRTERHPERVATHARNIRFAAESLLALVNELLAQAGAAAAEAQDPAGTLPAGRRSSEPHIADLPYVGPAAGQPSGGAHILLADDLDLNRKLIADMLGLEGHVVDCVADGAGAVAAASRHRYDLILMDMIMPTMDGLAATRAIRDLPAPYGNVPIVALTAHSLEEQLDACLKAGMDATLTKPMSIDALNEAVSTWIRGRKAA